MSLNTVNSTNTFCSTKSAAIKMINMGSTNLLPNRHNDYEAYGEYISAYEVRQEFADLSHEHLSIANGQLGGLSLPNDVVKALFLGILDLHHSQ